MATERLILVAAIRGRQRLVFLILLYLLALLLAATALRAQTAAPSGSRQRCDLLSTFSAGASFRLPHRFANTAVISAPKKRISPE
jgi:hypothetical protein